MITNVTKLQTGVLALTVGLSAFFAFSFSASAMTESELAHMEGQMVTLEHAFYAVPQGLVLGASTSISTEIGKPKSFSGPIVDCIKKDPTTGVIRHVGCPNPVKPGTGSGGYSQATYRTNTSETRGTSTPHMFGHDDRGGFSNVGSPSISEGGSDLETNNSLPKEVRIQRLQTRIDFWKAEIAKLSERLKLAEERLKTISTVVVPVVTPTTGGTSTSHTGGGSQGDHGGWPYGGSFGGGTQGYQGGSSGNGNSHNSHYTQSAYSSGGSSGAGGANGSSINGPYIPPVSFGGHSSGI